MFFLSYTDNWQLIIKSKLKQYLNQAEVNLQLILEVKQYFDDMKIASPGRF